MEKKKLLQVSNLKVKQGGYPILKGISLEVLAGEILAVIGPNGCGKTTLAYTLMGLIGYAPHEGSVFLQGKDITHLPINKRAQAGLALAWQEPARFEGLTVEEFLALGAADQEVHSNGEGLSKSLEEVGLMPEKYLQRMVDETLSGGERKRIELASIRLMNPRVVIFDEPDSGVDVVALNNINRMIAGFKEEGRGVLLITHSEEILKGADRAALLCSGELVTEGSTSEVGIYYKDRCVPCPDEQYSKEV